MQWNEPAARRDLARRSLLRMTRFYDAHPCEASPLHLLASAAVVLGDFWGASEPFARIGFDMSPIDVHGAPRTELWRAYAVACNTQQPMQIRTSRWLDAHVADLEAVREAGWVERFEVQVREHPHDATLQELQHHLDASLGGRYEDALATTGDWAGEAAFSTGMLRALTHMIQNGRSLLGTYAFSAARAVLVPRTRPPDQPSDRQTVAILLRGLWGSLFTVSLIRRGLRLRARGRVANADQWHLLENVLGDEAARVHPALRAFYSNPGAWDARANFHCSHPLVRLGIAITQRVTGQGLSETAPGEHWPARFQVFSRQDGTMHFVREIDCGDQLRVFDSDFAPGLSPEGEAAVMERFPSLGVTVPLVPTLHPDGSLELGANRVYWGRVALPGWFRVVFHGRPSSASQIRFEGSANLRLETWGGWMLHRLWIPARLGTLIYEADIRVRRE